MHYISPWLMLIILFGISALITTGIYLGRTRISTKRTVEEGFNDQVQYNLNMIKQLNGALAKIENASKTIRAIKHFTSSHANTTPSPQSPSAISEDNIQPTEIGDITENEPVNRQANILTLNATQSPSDKDSMERSLGEVAVKMRKLVKLLRLMQVEAQTFDRATPSTTAATINGSSKTERYLPFFLSGDQLFSVGIQNVKEVIEAGRLISASSRTGKPGRAISLRGSVVPVMDLSAFIGGEPIEVNRNTLIIILEVNHGENSGTVGIKVSSIGNPLNIDSPSIEPHVAKKTDTRSFFIAGTLKIDNRSMILLDIGQGLEMSKLIETNFAHTAYDNSIKKNNEEIHNGFL